MTGRAAVAVCAAVLAFAAGTAAAQAPATPAPAPDNTACLQSGGLWTVSAVIKSVQSFMGFYTIEFDSLVPGSPVVAVPLDRPCLIGWAAGERLPSECLVGHGFTVTGPLSFDERRIAGVQVREISCSFIPAIPVPPQGLPLGNPI